MEPPLLYSGSVSSSSAKLLVLTLHSTALPEVILTSGGKRRRARVSKPRISGHAARYFESHGVRAFHAVVDRLSANTTYDAVAMCENKTSQPVRVHTLPRSLPTAGLTFYVASCHFMKYEGKQHEATLARIVRRPMRGVRPSFGILAGDNVYCDVPMPDAGAASIARRYIDYFLDDGYRRYRAAAPVFSTFDDHELWNDYPRRQDHIEKTWYPVTRKIFAKAALSCVDVFQAKLNPAPVVPKTRSFVFEISPVSFFVADLRTQRTEPSASTARMMPSKVLREFRDWAANLQAPGVLVLSQPLWIIPKHTKLGAIADHNPPHFSKEYSALWNAIRTAPHDILVISGDVHYSHLLKHDLGDRTVLEFVTSPVAHIPKDWDVLTRRDTPRQGGPTKIDAPKTIPGLGWTPSCLMATTARNALGLVHLRLKDDGVGVDFDIKDVDRESTAAARRNHPVGRMQLASCTVRNKYVLH